MQRNRLWLLVVAGVAVVTIAVLIDQARENKRLLERNARRVWFDEQRVLATGSEQHLRRLAAWAVGQEAIADWKRINARSLLLELVLLPGEDADISWDQERHPVRRERILKALLNPEAKLNWDASVGRWRVLESREGSSGEDP